MNDATNPVHVIIVCDSVSGNEALYVGGDLKTQNLVIYGSEIAKFTKGMAVTVSLVVVDMPKDVSDYPKSFDQCMLWNPQHQTEMESTTSNGNGINKCHNVRQ